jgi:hypothetical protein
LRPFNRLKLTPAEAKNKEASSMLEKTQHSDIQRKDNRIMMMVSSYPGLLTAKV